MGFIEDLLGIGAGDPTINAANRNKKDLKDLLKTGLKDIGTGYNTARGELQGSADLVDLGPNAGDIYRGALGLGGPEGTQAAQDAFTAGPGYQFTLDQGLQALNRGAAARGQFQSGETGLDTLRFAEGTAAGGWQDWLDNLTGGIDRSRDASGDLATLAERNSGQKVDLRTGIASGMMDATNQRAEGIGANKAWLPNLAGKAIGAFAGYGGF